MEEPFWLPGVPLIGAGVVLVRRPERDLALLVSREHDLRWVQFAQLVELQERSVVVLIQVLFDNILVQIRDTVVEISQPIHLTNIHRLNVRQRAFQLIKLVKLSSIEEILYFF